MKRSWIFFLFLCALIVGGSILVLITRTNALAPVSLVTHFPISVLVEEADTMNGCVECHEPVKFHTCETCHDEHGSAEMANVPFDDLILLQGDVPEPGYIAVNDILPYRDQPGTQVVLLDLLSEYGVDEFESVTLASRDEGWITIKQDNLTDEAVLLPHVDGVRFAAENLHISSWLKGVWRIIVVAKAKPLTLDGYRTSMGRLLLGPTRSVTLEETDTMLRSNTDGEVRKAKTASRIDGAGISDIVADPGFDTLVVRDAEGNEVILTDSEARGAVLAQMGKTITLVLPDRGRVQWIDGVVELVSED